MDKYQHSTIGNLCRIEKGVTGIVSAVPGEYPLVNTSAKRKSCNSFQFDTEAVCIPLVSSTGHGQKTLNYVHYQKGKFALGTILAAVIPRDPKILSAAFLHRYLQFNKDRKIVPLMKGAANVSLAVKDIAKIEIPVPTIDEQISFIELFNKLNDSNKKLQSELSSQSSCISLLRQSILKEAIEGKLTLGWHKKNSVCKGDPETDASALLEQIKTEKQKLIAEGKIRKEKPIVPIKQEEVSLELPEGWIWARLGEISDIAGGLQKTPLRTPRKNFYPYLAVQNVQRGYLNINEYGFFEASKEEVQKLRLQKADLLLIEGNGSINEIGRCAIWNNEIINCIHQNHVIRARMINLDMPFFIIKVLNSQFGIYQMQNKARTTTGLFNLGVGKLSQVLIPLPPLGEQRAICERVDRLLAMVDELEKQMSERKKQAEEFMQVVLREALRVNH